MIHEFVDSKCYFGETSVELVLFLHEVEVSVIEESFGREVAILEWDLCKHLLVTLTQDELPEHHELLS